MNSLFTRFFGLAAHSFVRQVMAVLCLLAAQGAWAQNVGVGTSNPQATLHVAGDGKFNEGIDAATLTIADMVDFTNVNSFSWPSTVAFTGLSASGVVNFASATSLSLPSDVDISNLTVTSDLSAEGAVDLSQATTINLGNNVKLEDMNDVGTLSPTDGDILTYSSGQWTASAPAGNSSVNFSALMAQTSATVDFANVSSFDWPSSVIFNSMLIDESLEITENLTVNGDLRINGALSTVGEVDFSGATSVTLPTTLELSIKSVITSGAVRADDGLSAKGSVDFAQATSIDLGAHVGLDDLSDVGTLTPADGDLLTYSSGQWTASAPAGGGALHFSSLTADAASTVDFGNAASITLPTTLELNIQSVTASGAINADGGLNAKGSVDFAQATSIELGDHVSLDDLNDVDVTGASDGYVLTYTGGSWVPSTCYSDIRFKKDIQPLGGTLGKVLQLRGVEYNWRKEEFPNRHFQDKHQIGFIAQELEAFYPDLVNTAGDGYKSVDYEKMAPILVEAIKEQQAIIEAQQQQLAELKVRVEKAEATSAVVGELMSRLEKLEGNAANASHPSLSK